jgi:hydroxyacylglutathione hydrolase
MGLTVERIPTLADNYTYLAICDTTRKAAVIDAPEAAPVIARVEALGVTVDKVLSTHHHFDHSAANPELAERFGAPVYGHASDEGRIPGFTHGLEEGDCISVGEQEAHILFIPAHTKGHIAYVFEEGKALFSGDTLFAGGCGRLFEGNPEMMYEALCEKLSKLSDDMRVFCGHEYTASNLAFAAHVEPDNAAVKSFQKRVAQARAAAAADWHDATPAEMTVPTTIGDERAINPFMRARSAVELGERRVLKDSF